ncbi:MAG: oxidoreductase [Acidimicrobiales bacterium]
MSAPAYTQVRKLATPELFEAHLEALGIDLPFDPDLLSGPDSPLAQPLDAGPLHIGNRFTVLPMEGWDGTTDGRPTDLTERRWRRFGESGAKLVWGGEAVAVRHDGRANPNQLVISPATIDDIAGLRQILLDAHLAAHGSVDELVVGLQLTHSGRYSRPDGATAPRTAYHHPILDRRLGIEGDPAPVFSDDELDELVDAFVAAAVLARQVGFDFVDVKHCHGYLGHELLSAVDRPGRYGGDLDGRTRFMRSIIDGIRHAAPGLEIGVRLSAGDVVPFRPGPTGVGESEPWSSDHYPYAFGGDGTGAAFDLDEPLAVLDRLASLDVSLVCITAGSPYTCPHVQRPALFPPSDGYRPPEDPLVGVARLLSLTADLKQARPDMTVVGSGYSYLQEWLPHVAQAAVARGLVDSVGVGRMVLSYPDLPADVLAGRPLVARQICRTFSDCTTAPRNGLVSGCWPLDEHYKTRPDRVELVAAKRRSSTAAASDG